MDRRPNAASRSTRLGALVLVLALISGCATESQDLAALGLWDESFRSEHETRILEARRRAEDLKVECMKQLGFQYFPAIASPATPSDEADERYAFGVSTRRFPEEVVFALLGNPGVVADVGEEEADYFQSLSPSEYEQYKVALYGDSQPVQPGTAPPSSVQAWWDGLDGCVGQATMQAYEESTGDPILSVIATRESLEERIAADPRMVEFEQSAIECVRSMGIEIESVELFLEDLEVQLRGVRLEVTAGERPQLVLSGDRAEVLGELQKREREVYSAVKSCRSSVGDLTDLRQTIAQELVG